MKRASFGGVNSRISSVAQLWLIHCDPMNHSTPGLSITNSWSVLKLIPIESVMPSKHLTLCRPLLLLPPIPPSIRVFSNESTLLMRWLKYWTFSFSISPSSEHPGLISFHHLPSPHYYHLLSSLFQCHLIAFWIQPGDMLVPSLYCS